MHSSNKSFFLYHLFKFISDLWRQACENYIYVHEYLGLSVFAVLLTGDRDRISHSSLMADPGKGSPSCDS